MQANTLTPQKLFAPQIRYVIPVFQRPYVWQVEKQWMPLWDDVRAVAEEVLTAGPDDSVPPHFLGAVVLDQQTNPSGYLAVRHVIDGQQRLITLQLLLNAARQVSAKHGHERDTKLLGTLVRNPADIVESDDEILKVWPIAADRAAFQAAMDDDHDNDHGKHRVSQGIRFLRERIEAWALEAPDEVAPAERLRALAKAIALNLKMVVIDLEDDDNAQAIFEALNDRGSPLLAADLIKNAVFQLAEKHRLNTNELDQYWATFDDKYWRKEVRQGRLNRPRIDVFLNYWLTMRRAHPVPSDHIFSDFRDHVLKGLSDVRPILAELREDSDCYRQLDALPPHSVEGTFHYRVIELADIAATMPLLLWLVRPASGIPEGARHQALRAVESWVIRRLLARVTLSDTNSLAVELLRHLKSVAPDAVGTATVDYLLQQQGESRRWPSDADVVGSLESMRLYQTLKPRRRARMLLEALEDSYRTAKTEVAHCPRGMLTIEHLMPQSWQRYWRDSIEPGSLDADDRDQRVQRLGNLTLVTKVLNPAVSNYPWLPSEVDGNAVEGKRQAIAQQLNKHLLEAYGDRWDDAAIDERASTLAQQATRSGREASHASRRSRSSVRQSGSRRRINECWHATNVVRLYSRWWQLETWLRQLAYVELRTRNGVSWRDNLEQRTQPPQP